MLKISILLLNFPTMGDFQPQISLEESFPARKITYFNRLKFRGGAVGPLPRSHWPKSLGIMQYCCDQVILILWEGKYYGVEDCIVG